MTQSSTRMGRARHPQAYRFGARVSGFSAHRPGAAITDPPPRAYTTVNRRCWVMRPLRPLGFQETLKVLSPLRFHLSRAIIDLRQSHPHFRPAMTIGWT